MRLRFLVLLATTTLAPIAAAQIAPTGAAPTEAPPAASEPPLPPVVDDPKLAPVPPPAKEVASWRDAVTVARNRSTDLRIARAEIERARGFSRQALAGALPSASGSASVSRTLLETGGSGGGASSPWGLRASVSVSQPVLAPRAWYAMGTAERAVRVAELSANDEERFVLGAVADAVVAVLVTERVAELNRVGLRTALETAELTRTRERLGAANLLDVVRVRQDAAQARSAVVSADESLAQAREALGTALGFGEPWGVAPAFDLTALEAGLREACTQVTDVAQRADVAATRAEIELAERDVTDVKLQLAPTIDLSTTLSAEAAGASGSAGAAWSIAAVLNVPIWDGGARYGSLRVTRAGVDQAQQRLEAAVRAAGIETQRALRGVQVAEESRAVAIEVRDLAVETDRLARLSFAAGRGTSLDLVQAAQQRRQAEIQLALREFDALAARTTALLAMSRCGG